MGWIIAGGLGVGLLLLMLLPVRIGLSLSQLGWQANLHIEVQYLFLRFTKAVDVTDRVATALETMWDRWRDKGRPVKPDRLETVRKAPDNKISRAAQPALRQLGRATRCQQLKLRVEVGGADAMESALMAALLWGGSGMLVAAVSHWVQVPRKVLSIAVVPNFEKPFWQVNLDCILAVRLGHAIMAIVRLLRQEMSRKEVFAWVRDSLRRKGDQPNVRAPHSGPDENGHGKP